MPARMVASMSVISSELRARGARAPRRRGARRRAAPSAGATDRASSGSAPRRGACPAPDRLAVDHARRARRRTQNSTLALRAARTPRGRTRLHEVLEADLEHHVVDAVGCPSSLLALDVRDEVVAPVVLVVQVLVQVEARGRRARRSGRIFAMNRSRNALGLGAALLGDVAVLARSAACSSRTMAASIGRRQAHDLGPATGEVAAGARGRRGRTASDRSR